MVNYAGQRVVSSAWKHYVLAPDDWDRDDRRFENKAKRVLSELWVSLPRTGMLSMLLLFDNLSIMKLNYGSILQDFFRREEGAEETARAVARRCCPKRVQDMFYEARIQAVIMFHAQHLHTKVTKTEARNMRLSKQEYMRVNK